MIPLRARLSATVIVAAMLVGVASPLFADEPHSACLAKQHECGKTAQLKACCCLEQGGPSDQATPAAGRTAVAQPAADWTLAVTSAPLALPGLLRHARVSTTAPRSSPPDLVTLFGTFLI